jgi:hypothetical protein
MRKLVTIAGILIVLTIGSCVAAYLIEDHRIGAFCNSVAVGSDEKQILNRASEMFGVEIRHQPRGTSFFVKSVFTYKTLCIVETENSRVTDTFFVND